MKKNDVIISTASGYGSEGEAVTALLENRWEDYSARESSE